MLVLTRNVRESVIVGDDHGPHRILKVTVLSVRGQRVKLGFEMDDNVSVHRQEIVEEIRDAAALAAIEPAQTPVHRNTDAISSAWCVDNKEAFEPQDVVVARTAQCPSNC